LYRIPNSATTITIRRPEWAGHVERMSDDRTVMKVFLGKPDVRRKEGRPKLRCSDCTENDLKSTDVKRWRKTAKGRYIWRSFCRRH
jgi:hypothetical protein